MQNELTQTDFRILYRLVADQISILQNDRTYDPNEPSLGDLATDMVLIALTDIQEKLTNGIKKNNAD